MTSEEYKAAFIRARAQNAVLSIKTQSEIAKAYRTATEELVKALKASLEKEVSFITINQQSQLLAELSAISGRLANRAAKLISEASSRAAEIASAADAEYLTGIAARVGASQLSPQAVSSIYARVNKNAVANAVTRMFGDGYTLSDRVWALKCDYETTVKEIISEGLARGRDPVKLIKDIQVYTVDGKLALADRWGGLERGTPEWQKRIRGRIDYRAQRLVRSEIQATVQSLAVSSAEANPGTTGEFEWVLGPGMAHCSECSDYSRQRFTAETIPEYPHPNCGCQVRPVLRDREQFINDLSSWTDGVVTDENRYIDDWAQNYLNAA